MPPEVEESRAKPQTPPAELPSFDFYSFHQQAGKPLSDNNAPKDRPQGSIELTNPFSFNQGPNGGFKKEIGRSSEDSKGSDAKPTGGATSKKADDGGFKKPDGMICVDGVCRPMTPAEKEAEAAKRAGKPGDLIFPISPFNFQKYGTNDDGIKQAGHETPAEKTNKPADNLKELPNLTPPGSTTGRSSIVDAYERRQGARQAGGGSLPGIDAIPNNPGSDVRPWTPPNDNNNNNNDKIDPRAKEVLHLSSEEQFKNEVLNSKVPVIVDFYATWCGPCKQLAPNLKALANEKGGAVKVVKVDAEQFPNLAAEYSVHGYPTMVYINNGGEVGRTSGYHDMSQLRAIADKLRK